MRCILKQSRQPRRTSIRMLAESIFGDRNEDRENGSSDCYFLRVAPNPGPENTGQRCVQTQGPPRICGKAQRVHPIFSS